MKKYISRLSRHISILLAALIAIALWPASGRTEERPAGDTPGEHPGTSTKPEGMSEMFEGRVVEKIDAGRHIYVRIDTGNEQVWVVVPAFDGKPGDNVVVPPGIPIADFKSKKLNRTFKMIYFVGGIRRAGESKAQ